MSANPARHPIAVPAASIAFVAAGPGDPELVTVRAAAVIGAADLILVDADAKAVADRYASADAEVVVAVDDDGLPLAQAARAKLVVDAAKAGRSAVRVLAGDPVLDGSIVAEAAVVTKAKLTFEVVPGVSPVTGIPAYAGIPLLGADAREVHILNADNLVDYDKHID